MAESTGSDKTNPLTDFSSAEFDIEEVRRQLTDDGVAVVHNVIPADDCDKYVDQLKEWLTRFPDTFPDNVHSVIHKYGLPHTEPAWKVRMHVKPVFSALWGTDKLLTSTDGVAIGRPAEDGKTKFGKPVPIDGQHFDQGPQRQGFHVYQGAAYLAEALYDDWCFTVMHKSNHFHEEFYKHYPAPEYDHRKFKKPEIKWLQEQGCEVRRIAVPKGGLLLWDSRTAHTGAPPLKGRANPGRWRYIVFVCQSPAIWATPEDLAVKKLAYKEMKCSRHWASNGTSNFDIDKTDLDLTEQPAIMATEEVQLLSGHKEYDFEDGHPNGPPTPTWVK